MPERFAMRRGPLIIGASAALLIAALYALLPDTWRAPLVARAEDGVMRLALTIMPPPVLSQKIVVIDIDREAIDTAGPWPWPRDKMARLFEVLAPRRPAALAVDILFAGDDPRSPVAELRRRGITLDPALGAALAERAPDGDAALAAALATAPVVLGLAVDPAGTGSAPVAPLLTRGPAILDPAWKATGVIGPGAAIAGNVSGLGVLALPGDVDGITRRVPLFVNAGAIYPGLALETLRVAREASGYVLDGERLRLLIGDVAIPLAADGLLRLLPGQPENRLVTRIPAQKALSAPGLVPEGALVLIGGSAPELGGLRAGQDDNLVPSVMIHARALTQLLAGLVPRPLAPEHAWQAGLALLAAGVAIGAGMALTPLAGLGLAMAGLAALLALSVGLFARGAWLFVPIAPALILVGAYAATTLASFIETRRREARVRARFEQHLSPQVVSMIVANPSSLKLRGEKREITALFTDVEGFTAMTERAGAEALVAVLDAYFEGVAAIVIHHGGMIDKVVGDAIHAYFNVPFDLADHPAHALACAREIAHWTAGFARREPAAGLGFGRTRIGIETGEAVVGDVGIRSKLDYTAHGTVVNTAARLEAANKDFGSTICLGPRVAARLGEETLRPLGTIALRGLSTPATVFEPWPEAADAPWQARYRAALALRATDPEAAARAFARLADAFDDPVCRKFA